MHWFKGAATFIRFSTILLLRFVDHPSFGRGAERKAGSEPGLARAGSAH